MTTVKKAPIELKAKVIACYRFGYTWKQINELTGVSVSAAREWCAESPFTKGDLENEAVQNAVELLGVEINKKMASLVLGVANDSLTLSVQSNQLAYKLIDNLNKLDLDNINDIGKASRALAGIATAIKATGDYARHLKTDLNLDALGGEILPFIIHGMTEEDLVNISAQVELDARAAKLGNIPESRLAIDAKAKAKIDAELDDIGI